MPISRRATVWLAALIVAANGFFPALWILFTSLKTERELINVPITILPTAPTLDNYVRVFTDQPIGTFLWNSFVVAVLSTILCVTVSALAAYALVKITWRLQFLVKHKNRASRLKKTADAKRNP